MSVKTKRVMVLVGCIVYGILHMLPCWTPELNTTLLFGWWPFETFYRVLLIFVGGTLFAWLFISWGMPRDTSDAIRPAEEEKGKGGAE